MPSRSEDRKLQFTRINIVGVVIALIFLTLAARLWYLQVALGDDLLKQADFNRKKTLYVRAPRGTILDRKGRVLATSRPQFVVLAIPERLEEDRKAMHTLCGVLQITPQELESIIEKKQERPGSPVRVKVDVDLATVARIGELRMMLPGVSVELDQIRHYPDGAAVAQLMGHLGEITQEQLEKAKAEGKQYRPGDYVGKNRGVEQQYEDYLKGTDGGKEVEVNAFGRVTRILGERASISGKTLKLTIDRDLQVAAYQALGNQVGAAIAVDPRTGKVLCMVSTPAYDPNVFAARLKPDDWREISTNKHKPLQNRCISSVYPPGSTFKPIMSTAGLMYGMCDLNTTHTCPGGLRVGRYFRCWKVHGSGVDFNRAVAESCDVWFYHLARKLEIDRMAEVAKQFGLSEPTGIDLAGEAAGIMPSREWRKKVNPKDPKWYPGFTINTSIGQGDVMTTPLQMAMVSAGVANYGVIYRPYVLDAVLDSSDNVIHRTKPEVRHEVKATQEQFQKVIDAMVETVESGTGRTCKLEDVSVGGKTGSAQNPHGPAHGWFICFAPGSNTEIAVASIVENGAHGATTAAPVCRAILDVYFGKKKPEEIEARKSHTSGD